MDKKLNILVTGAAGFIGWKVCEFLLAKPELIPTDIVTDDSATISVVGIDNMNDYYDVRLKEWRLEQLKRHPNFEFHKLDIENRDGLERLFQQYSTRKTLSSLSSAPFFAVINLAARAGVRYSMENPFVYYTTNVLGTLNLLELCRVYGIKKFILASTSSLYAGQKMPFKETLPVNEPISPYAASKKGAEVTCYTYHRLYDLDITIVRYFTVYGPAGRPDMSIFRFIYWIDQEEPVIIYGDGTQSRDFTYVDDIARGTILALRPLGFEIINLGGDQPHKLIDVLHNIEGLLGKKAKIEHQPFHPADMLATWADVTKAKELLNWRPQIDIGRGIESAVDWYQKNRSWAKGIKI